MATDRSSYFPDNVLEPIFEAPRVKTPRFSQIFVGIDPASHNSSTMGLAAIGVHEGTVFVMGIAGVKVTATVSRPAAPCAYSLLCRSSVPTCARLVSASASSLSG